MNRFVQRAVMVLACFALSACGKPPSDDDVPVVADVAPARVAPPPPAPAPERAHPARTSFACSGMEPDWSLQVSPGIGWLRLPEGDTEFTGTLKETATGAFTWLGEPAHDPEQSVALLIVPDHCFPADGGAALPFSARLGLPDGREADGCCLPSPGD